MQAMERSAYKKIKEIGIFGSYVRGEQKKKSDVDILVEFENEVVNV
jgi:predicted nucleotidyltransferase